MDEQESSNPFNLGDVVVLNSGGPKMVVMGLSGGDVFTAWFNDGVQIFEHGDFPYQCLTAAED